MTLAFSACIPPHLGGSTLRAHRVAHLVSLMMEMMYE